MGQSIWVNPFGPSYLSNEGVVNITILRAHFVCCLPSGGSASYFSLLSGMLKNRQTTDKKMSKSDIERASKHPAGCGGSFFVKTVINYAQLKTNKRTYNDSIDMRLTNRCLMIYVLMTLLC